MRTGSCRGKKRESDPLKLKLQMVGSHHTAVGDWSEVLCIAETANS